MRKASQVSAKSSMITGIQHADLQRAMRKTMFCTTVSLIARRHHQADVCVYFFRFGGRLLQSTLTGACLRRLRHIYLASSPRAFVARFGCTISAQFTCTQSRVSCEKYYVNYHRHTTRPRVSERHCGTCLNSSLVYKHDCVPFSRSWHDVHF